MIANRHFIACKWFISLLCLWLRVIPEIQCHICNVHCRFVMTGCTDCNKRLLLSKLCHRLQIAMKIQCYQIIVLNQDIFLLNIWFCHMTTFFTVSYIVNVIIFIFVNHISTFNFNGNSMSAVILISGCLKYSYKTSKVNPSYLCFYHNHIQDGNMACNAQYIFIISCPIYLLLPTFRLTCC